MFRSQKFKDNMLNILEIMPTGLIRQLVSTGFPRRAEFGASHLFGPGHYHYSTRSV